MNSVLRTPSVCLDFEISRGVIDDYKLLCGFHYREKRPANFVRIFTAVAKERRSLDRFLCREVRGEVVGVLVESMPTMRSKMRDVALKNRYSNLGSAGNQMRLVNAEFRSISRVIVHPRWRGLGVARGLVEHVLKNATTAYTEATAMMGHVNPFFENAGMRSYVRHRHIYDARFVQVLEIVGVGLTDLCRQREMVVRIGELTGQRKAWFCKEADRWLKQISLAHGYVDDVVGRMILIKTAGLRLVGQPIYYLKANDLVYGK